MARSSKCCSWKPSHRARDGPGVCWRSRRKQLGGVDVGRGRWRELASFLRAHCPCAVVVTTTRMRAATIPTRTHRRPKPPAWLEPAATRGPRHLAAEIGACSLAFREHRALHTGLGNGCRARCARARWLSASTVASTLNTKTPHNPSLPPRARPLAGGGSPPGPAPSRRVTKRPSDARSSPAAKLSSS